MDLKIGEHLIGNLFGFNVHLDTLITLWAAMALILLFALLSVIKINIIPNKLQAVFEKIVTIFIGLTKDLKQNQGSSALVLMCIFLLIITSNLLGQLPFKLIHLQEGEFASPTNDINVTAALAVFVLIYYFYKGLKAKGLSYFKHYIKPVWFIAPINILEDVIRPFTLALRLFANILAGEIMIVIFGSIIAMFLTPQTLTNIAHNLFNGVLSVNAVNNIGLFFGSLLSLPVMFFELMVAFVQALVFTLLANSYISGAVGENH